LGVLRSFPTRAECARIDVNALLANVGELFMRHRSLRGLASALDLMMKAFGDSKSASSVT
jgi:hypothetical protein